MTQWHLDEGLILTDIPILSVAPIQRAMQGFMAEPMCSRRDFLQKAYGFAFDGYSHYGQPDSSHQAADDLLHSFVLSDHYPAARYPNAFQPFVREHWPALASQIRTLQLSLLSTLPAELTTWYRQFAAHMLSANFYPPLQHFSATAAGNTRLSAHPDVSLFTVFPFGLDSAFEYEDGHGQWLSAPATDCMIAFPGYLLEWLSHGRIKALNHRVRLDTDHSRERYSFAVFSIPARGATVARPSHTPGKNPEVLTAQAYFAHYCGLWDY
ncbi:Uncharacterised protein [Halioglobus japonicus]|nr:Uncharacterised protein [Halioglobus japonicus]